MTGSASPCLLQLCLKWHGDPAKDFCHYLTGGYISKPSSFLIGSQPLGKQVIRALPELPRSKALEVDEIH